MDSSDVVFAAGEDEPSADAQTFTIQAFADTELKGIGKPSGTRLRLPTQATKRANWPPPVLFDAIYASTLLKHFGQLSEDKLAYWKDIQYDGIPTTAAERYIQQFKNGETVTHSSREKERRNFRRVRDKLDILDAFRYQLIPREDIIKYREDYLEEEREKVFTWREGIIQDDDPAPDMLRSDSERSLDMPVIPPSEEIQLSSRVEGSI